MLLEERIAKILPKKKTNIETKILDQHDQAYLLEVKFIQFRVAI